MTTEKQRFTLERLSWLKLARMFDRHGGVMLLTERCMRDKALAHLIAEGYLKASPEHPALKGQMRYRVTAKGRDWAKRAEMKIAA